MTSAIAAALAKAQAEMGKALKDSVNPAFRSKYADLGSVMDACLPALNRHGIAVIQPIISDEFGRFVQTVLIHESGETLECSVPLIVGKQDMQGLGSAITYGRRYGLMSMAGIAPEDDDGNAAAAAPVQRPAERQASSLISADQFIALKARMEAAGVPEDKICARYSLRSIEEMPSDAFQKAMGALQKTIDDKKPARADLEDEIPY